MFFPLRNVLCYQTPDMHRVTAYARFILYLLVGIGVWTGKAETFLLENGTKYEGSLADINEDSFVVSRAEGGGYYDRTDLVYLSQETLRRLAENPDYTDFVTTYIDLPEEDMKPPEINVRPVERLPLPEERTSFFGSFASPMGILFIIAAYLGNLLAAYEVAAYRGRSSALVCGLSVILPVVTPIIFLSLPAAEGSYADVSAHEEEEVEEEETAAPPPPPPPPSAPAAPGVPQSGPAKLGLKKSAGPAGGGAATAKVYTRSDTDFNRNFFETTFSEFFRVVPSAAIKDMVLEFKGTKKEFVAKRITRISANELHIQLVDGKKEMSLSFGEIVQVKLRHKNDK